MQRYAIFTFLVYVFAQLALPACKHDPIFTTDPDPIDTIDEPIDTMPMAMPCSPDSVYFQNQVLPLLVSTCSKPGCHNEIDHQKDVILTSYESLMSTVEGVKNNNWEDNELMEVLFLNNPDKRMPPAPNQKLTFDQVQLIGKWIAQGALNNACDENVTGCDTANVKYTAFIKPLIQTRCQGCHSGANATGGVNLTTYAGVKTVALNGKLYAAITRTTNWMPKNGTKLDACTLAKVKAWVNAGALEN